MSQPQRQPGAAIEDEAGRNLDQLIPERALRRGEDIEARRQHTAAILLREGP